MAEHFPEIRLESAGVDAIMIRFGGTPGAALSGVIARYSAQLADRLDHLLLNLVPSHQTLMVQFDRAQLSYSEFRLLLESETCKIPLATVHDNAGRKFLIPVCYDLDFAPDLVELSDRLNLTMTEIINLHCEPDYQVLAVGFSPGFGYLGDIATQLRLPRLSTPRLKVPAGSVAIADRFTAIYPQETPGGWWLIGNCPLELHPGRQTDIVFTVGDRIKFKPVNQQEFHHIRSNATEYVSACMVEEFHG